MKTHAEMMTEWKNDPAYQKEYDALEDEFALYEAFVKARYEAGLTQADIALRMGTKAPAIARLESGGGRKRHSPSMTTLKKYAEAVGCRLEIKLTPQAT